MLEDRSQYQYYVNGAWTNTMPGLGDSGSCNIPNVSAGGQGTYYFSYYWNKWVWIGQALFSVSSAFMVTTADNIEGPWAEPVFFYQGHDGTYNLGAYTLSSAPRLERIRRCRQQRNIHFVHQVRHRPPDLYDSACANYLELRGNSDCATRGCEISLNTPIWSRSQYK